MPDKGKKILTILNKGINLVTSMVSKFVFSAYFDICKQARVEHLQEVSQTD